MAKKLSNKQKVFNLFKTGKVLYFSDISDALDLDLQVTVRICEELVKEQKIRVAEKRSK